MAEGKPIIGITVESKHDPANVRTQGKIELNWNYFQMVTEAGGVPIVIPPTADAAAIAGLIDGWLIPGGLDIDARRFGEENHAQADIQDPSRYEIESALYQALPESAPILGICYGCQFLNVVRGGNLNQHLDDLGRTGHTGGDLQRYSLAGPSRLGDITGTEQIEGRSYHHQGIDRVADGLQVSALADDGTIEAVEAMDRPWQIGVQWHPERTPEDPPTRRLFQSFINAARAYRATKEK